MSRTALVLRVKATGDSSELLAPSVGIFTPTVAVGELVGPGQAVGTIDVLGVHRALVVPNGVAGKVTNRLGGSRSRVPAQHGDALITVSTAAVGEVSADSPQGSADVAGSLSFTAPMSGRFYGRPSPNEPPFVSVGDTVNEGQTVGLLEVMKTFNRLVYQGEGLPDGAIVKRIVPNDGDDVVRGDPILLLGADEG